MKQLRNLRAKLFTNNRGSVALMTAITMPVFIGMGALAFDVGYAYNIKTEMQQAIDIASLAALKKMKDDNPDPLALYGITTKSALRDLEKDIIKLVNKNAPAVGRNISVKKEDIQFGVWNFSTQKLNTAQNAAGVNAVKITAILNEIRGNALPTFFGSIFRDSLDISVETTAFLPIPPSFHMLSNDAVGAFTTTKGTDIDVASIQVNSNARGALESTLYAKDIGTPYYNITGTINGIKTGRVKEKQPAVADFLQDLPEISTGGRCTRRNFKTRRMFEILRPGIYCGGLKITNVQEVKFLPGTYIIKGGPLLIDKTMKGKNIIGEDVLIYLSGKDAEINAQAGNLYFTGPKTGNHAGVTFFSARGNSAPKKHVFHPPTKLYVHGVFYAPDSDVEFISSRLEGTCRIVCFISKTLLLDKTHVDYLFTHLSAGPDSPLKPIKERLPNPPSLEKKMRPYTIEGVT
ncbi:pilus assembly protein TadG-related protein [Lentilitoribacter sp. EG35]|uniref:pilus assembly protein TadG-related protein n=1 Tax=Lentilitoribacter sp. EG35 TaxID=3234192 RepID=UPI0034613811